MTIETGEGYSQEANLCVSCGEIYGVVLKHRPAYKWELDSIEVLIEDRIYQVHRTLNTGYEGCEDPFFNIKVIDNE